MRPILFVLMAFALAQSDNWETHRVLPGDVVVDWMTLGTGGDEFTIEYPVPYEPTDKLVSDNLFAGLYCFDMTGVEETDAPASTTGFFLGFKRSGSYPYSRTLFDDFALLSVDGAGAITVGATDAELFVDPGDTSTWHENM